MAAHTVCNKHGNWCVVIWVLYHDNRYWIYIL